MNKTALSILLAFGFLQAQAQGGISNQPSGVAFGNEAAQAAPTIRTPTKESHWFARIGVLGAIYHSGATIATNGRVIPGATATVSNNVTVAFEIGYDITKNISAPFR